MKNNFWLNLLRHKINQHWNKKNSLFYQPRFRFWFEQIEKSQWFKSPDLADTQINKLKSLITNSYNFVPYYHELFDKLHLKPENIKNLTDLNKIPLLTKELIRKNYKKLTSVKLSATEMIASHTSGSTGKPLHFLLDKESDYREQAFIFRSFTYGDYRLGDLVINLRSYVPKPGEPLWLFEGDRNFLYLSAYNLTAETMFKYVKIINATAAKVLRGYPSALYILADFLLKNNISLPSITTIITSSETLLEKYRSTIETAFRQKVLDWYGANERAITCSQCRINNGYHINDDYGILEITDNTGQNIKHGQGNIVATNLDNFAMPLIRYNINDLAEINKNNCDCACGRGLSIALKKIIGRQDEILIFQGRAIPPINFYTLFHEIIGVAQFQLIKVDDQELLAKLVINDQFQKSTALKITAELQSRVGKQIKINLEYAPIIPRDLQTGKIKCIINKYDK